MFDRHVIPQTIAANDDFLKKYFEIVQFIWQPSWTKVCRSVTMHGFALILLHTQTTFVGTDSGFEEMRMVLLEEAISMNDLSIGMSKLSLADYTRERGKHDKVLNAVTSRFTTIMSARDGALRWARLISENSPVNEAEWRSSLDVLLLNFFCYDDLKDATTGVVQRSMPTKDRDFLLRSS